MNLAPKNRPAIRALVIAASTGGPQVVREICSHIARYCGDIPIFVVLHMPEGFAPIFAAQLERSTGLPCRPSANGETVRNGHIYVASSGYHLALARKGLAIQLQHQDSAALNFCKPAADILFCSAADIYRDGLVALVLSGMGIDGYAGCHAITQRGGVILAQNQESCAVWGMPGAVAKSDVECSVLSPDGISSWLQLRLNIRERLLA